MSPPPSTAAGPPAASRRRRGWRWRIVSLAVALALVVAFLWAGWYVYNRGFTRKWREQLAAELRRRGFDFTAARLTLNPFEGLVAEDADLYLLDEHHTHLAAINRVAVDINVRRLIQGKSFLNSLDLRDTRLTLPVDVTDPEGPVIKIRHLNAKVSFLPGEVRVTQAQGDFYGLQISVSGSLQLPENFSPSGAPATPEDRARRRYWARAITGEIEKVRAERVPPSLEVRFQGDLAHPEGLRASAQLQGAGLQRGSYRLDRLLLRLDYAAGAFHLRQGELADRRGALTLIGDFNPADGEARFQVQSGTINPPGVNPRGTPQPGLDVLALAHEFVDPALGHGWSLRDTPRLQIDGRWRLGSPPPTAETAHPAPAEPALQLTGRLALGRFAYHLASPEHTFDFDRAETDFSWSGDRWYLRDLRLVRPGVSGPQQVAADVLSEPGQARVRLTSTFDPVAFVPLLPAKAREAAARLEFRDPPRVDLVASGRSLDDPLALKMEGQLTLGRTRYRGVGINRLHGDWTLADGLLSGRHLTLERDEGVGTADALVYNFEKHDLRLDNVHTGLDPGTAGVWLDPDVYHTIQPFHFPQAAGAVHPRQRPVQRRAQLAPRHGGQRARGDGLRFPQEEPALPERRRAGGFHRRPPVDQRRARRDFRRAGHRRAQPDARAREGLHGLAGLEEPRLRAADEAVFRLRYRQGSDLRVVSLQRRQRRRAHAQRRGHAEHRARQRVRHSVHGAAFHDPRQGNAGPGLRRGAPGERDLHDQGGQDLHGEPRREGSGLQPVWPGAGWGTWTTRWISTSG